MARPARFLASAAIAGLVILTAPIRCLAQGEVRGPALTVGRMSPFSQGSILGMVQDDRGVPVSGVVVSALGATTTVAVTTSDGRFQFGELAPGPYVVRAHIAGFVAPPAQTVQVKAGVFATPTSLRLRRAGIPVLEAGLGSTDAKIALPGAFVLINQIATDAEPPSEPPVTDPVAAPADRAEDGHDEMAWRLRHARRGVLKDVSIPDGLLLEDRPDDGVAAGIPGDLLERTVGTPSHVAGNFFADTPFSGQVNLLATGSLESPQQLFSPDNLSRNVAFVRLGAPVGDRGDWTVSGALTQADMSSWIVAGAFTTRTPDDRHGFEAGLSYSTQRDDGGNPLAVRDVVDGARNAGTIYAYDSFALTPAVTVAYGGTYSRYDYLASRNLLSPRVALTVSATDRLRVTAELSRRALAPGAEEFLPRGDEGIWLPPQRTFSSLEPGQGFEPERTTHMAVGIERDFGCSTLGFRAFRQEVSDQLITLFGQDLPQQPETKLGHYLVGNAGDGEAAGYRAEFRTVFAGRVHGSVAYTVSNAQLMPADGLRYVLLVAPSVVRPTPERIHDLSTTIETTVPETATRILVVYRVSTGFAHAGAEGESPLTGGRFDVQVRQSLPFINFSNARWEVLLAVRNFFREGASDQSVYDELLVVRPPTRVVGGVTLHF